MIRTCPPFRIESVLGEEITSVGDWCNKAAPKRPSLHWQPYRSAMESARAWLPNGPAPTFPVEIGQLLDSHPATRGFCPEVAIPELVTRLDDYPGEHRNHDLVAIGTASTGAATLLGIEAKADESFGSHTVRGYLTACEKAAEEYPAKLAEARAEGRRRLPQPSNAAARIKELCTAAFGPPADGKDVAEIAEPLRYQLITALIGTLIEARSRGCTQAVLVIHEFLSKPDPARGCAGTSEGKVRANVTAWHAFVKALTGEAPRQGGALRGPFYAYGINRRVPSDVPVFLGKATTQLN